MITTRLTFVEPVTGQRYILLNDFMGHVELDNKVIGTRHQLFPDIKEVSWYSGFLILKDGTIRCAEEANMHVAQYDGCAQEEMNIYSHIG